MLRTIIGTNAITLRIRVLGSGTATMLSVNPLVEYSHALRATTGQTSENAIELFYKANIKDWMFVQPELQYIARPSGMERDALLAGINFGVRF